MITLPPIDFDVWKETDGPHTQSKVYRDGRGHILKYMRGGNPDKVRREFDFLQRLQGNDYFPKPLDCGLDYIVMSDVGEREGVRDLARAVQHGLHILETLREAGIRHNDLRSLSNIIVTNDTPHVIDFGRAQWASEEPLLRVYPDDALLITLGELYPEGHWRKS